MMATRKNFTPALGFRFLTPIFDPALRLFTREDRWRPAFVVQIAPRAGERIVDIGAGTGTLTRALKRAAPAAAIIGVDPDPEVLAKAIRQAEAEGLGIDYREGFFGAAFAAAEGPFDKVVTSLVLHQVPLAGKREIVAAAFRALRPGGEFLVCDYGLQRGLMRLLFVLTVQMIDGFEDTGQNARGIVPRLMADCGFDPISEEHSFKTVTGSISLIRARKP